MDDTGGPLRELHEAEMLPFLPLLGSIAVDSARIEWGLAGLYAMLAPGRSMPQALGLAHDRLRRYIRRDLGPSRSDGDAFVGAISYWTEAAFDLLSRRGMLMHSAWIVGRATDEAQVSVYTQHNRSGATDRRSVEELAAFAKELHDHMSDYPAMWAAATLGAGIASTYDLQGPEDPPAMSESPGAQGG